MKIRFNTKTTVTTVITLAALAAVAILTKNPALLAKAYGISKPFAAHVIKRVAADTALMGIVHGFVEAITRLEEGVSTKEAVKNFAVGFGKGATKWLTCPWAYAFGVAGGIGGINEKAGAWADLAVVSAYIVELVQKLINKEFEEFEDAFDFEWDDEPLSPEDEEIFASRVRDLFPDVTKSDLRSYPSASPEMVCLFRDQPHKGTQFLTLQVKAVDEIARDGGVSEETQLEMERIREEAEGIYYEEVHGAKA